MTMKPIILFVDDEPLILRAIERLFRQSDFQIMTAGNSVDALRILQESPVSVLVSDYSMPDQTGAELLATVRVRRPETVRMILSGNSDQKAVIEAINKGEVSKFLTKPWDDQGLMVEIDAAVCEWRSRVYTNPDKELFNQAALAQLIDSELQRDKPSQAVVVVLAIRGIDCMEATLGTDALLEFLAAIAPPRESLGDGVSLGLLDARHFCCFLKIHDNGQAPELAAQSLLETFPVNPVVNQQTYRLAYDVGYAVAGSDDSDSTSLITNAQLAMKEARHCQASSVVVFDERLNASRGRQSKLEQGLCTALSKGEFVLHYQPKIGLSNNLLHGAEALIRWNSKDMGMLSPVEFIPLIERNGLINDIGEWVINEAIRQWVEWFPSSDSDPVISVNVSPEQLKDERFIQRLENALARHAIQPFNLELEITESMMVEDMGKVVEILKQIRNLGVQLSIDDFGTGYSSLSYLSQLPVNAIKIDRSFIMPMLESRGNLGLVRNLIRLGHDMGMQLVAEGVEDEAQLVALRDLGCDAIQGYYFSPPVAAEEFIRKTSDIMTLHAQQPRLRA